MSKHGTSSARDRAVALVMVLWVVLVASVMLLGVMRASRTQASLAHAELSAVQAHWLARAGVEQAMAVLEDDDPASDSTFERWYRDETVFEKVSLGSGTFSVHSAADDNRPGLDDESARVNLNIADKNQLTELKTLSDGQINALLEWRAAAPSTPGGGGAGAGANQNQSKGGYYVQLQFPYEMRGKDLQTHRELFLIQGFEDRSFFGKSNSVLGATGSAAQTTVYSYQPNHDRKGTQRVNFNSASAQQLQERFNFTPQLAQAVQQGRNPQYQNLGALLNIRAGPGPGGGGDQNNQQTGGEPPVSQITMDWLAAHAEEISLTSETRLPGKINLNTAPREVLITLPGMSSDLADRVIASRSSSGGVFKTLKDLLDRHVIEPNGLRGMIDRVTVRSDVFSVESIGVSASGLERRIFAVIDRGEPQMKILYWYQTP